METELTASPSVGRSCLTNGHEAWTARKRVDEDVLEWTGFDSREGGNTVVSFHQLLSLTCASTWFERVSMMVILLNCMTLGMYQPCQNIDCSSDRCQILQAFDAFIYIFFALEMVVKMVALGIFGRRCYLGDTWNRLDFFIVMAG
ncbi:voltage-dependent T-type calcium channel subunit alpha-1I-like [Sphaeramia orbicularis]|uniref:voltage-dependent T-type calcium channel subunit alpha-1I-like n=1 Tax=Sphaeramia orbicularis TaxID=375764 RepID=UPI00117C0DF9|nr:voltage-dependent T-type calcium channel subunit alpha-1I-like [Sphaeramia orbicularis]